MSKIHLNHTTIVDLPKLIDSRLLIQANSGGGKSWAIRRIVEQAFGKVQIIMIDPEGEFTNLRTKFDFVYAGKGGDAPVESRSAALLAHRLLELKASAIVDLYEMPPQERKHFVKLFCEAMVNAPKELWHDVLVIIDEAHVFAPEKGESEAMGSVIDLATRGRKRGYCVVLATQRLPKLNKDAAAECNNKLIGRASQDIDRKRAAEELGFTSKEQILSLRDLYPGEFYAFGPAISREVIKIEIGDVAVKPPLRSQSKIAPPPPSNKVKEILGKLADLPQEAQKEANTVAELKAENSKLKGEITRNQRKIVENDPKIIKEEVDRKMAMIVGTIENGYKSTIESWKNYADELISHLNVIDQTLKNVLKLKQPSVKPAATYTGPRENMHSAPHIPEKEFKIIADNRDYTLGLCERKIYSFLFANPARSFSKVQLGVITGYSPKSGGFNNALGKLRSLDLITGGGEGIILNSHDPALATENIGEYSIELWKQKLGKCEREIFSLLLDKGLYDKEAIGAITGYSPISGGFNNALGKLNSLGLIKREAGMIKINPEILEL